MVLTNLPKCSHDAYPVLIQLHGLDSTLHIDATQLPNQPETVCQYVSLLMLKPVSPAVKLRENFLQG
jgi:hypothetical protein